VSRRGQPPGSHRRRGQRSLPQEGCKHRDSAGAPEREARAGESESQPISRFRVRFTGGARPKGTDHNNLIHSTYDAFVAQGPVLVLIALALRSMSLPGEVKFLILGTTAAVGSFALSAATLAATSRPAGSS